MVRRVENNVQDPGHVALRDANDFFVGGEKDRHVLDIALLDELDIGLGIRSINQRPGDVSIFSQG